MVVVAVVVATTVVVVVEAVTDMGAETQKMEPVEPRRLTSSSSSETSVGNRPVPTPP